MTTIPPNPAENRIKGDEVKRENIKANTVIELSDKQAEELLKFHSRKSREKEENATTS